MERTLALACLGFLFWLPARALAEEVAAEPSFSVLSYNIHGLPSWFAADDPRDRMPTIGWLADHYDVVAFQEDFEYHGIVAEQLEDSVGTEGNGMGWDPRRVLAKILISPVTVLIPHFSPPYGSGVSTFVPEAMAIDEEPDREPYGVCFGWIRHNGDCWAVKGYLRVGIRSSDGAEIDVYNTHLESGPSEESIETRRRQLEILAEAIEARPDTRAVIVVGDLNSAYARPGDREGIKAFRDRTGLRDSGAGPELPFWRERDYILYRSGTRVALEVLARGEATEFTHERRALSDHAALYARFRATPIGESAPGEQEPAP